MVDYIALSIPIFFILIGIELLYGVLRKVKLYRLNDSITNISLGIGQQITGIFMKTALFFGYLFLYENFRIFTIENSLLTWVLLFLGVDFFYYWFHRLSHEVNAMWAAHIVHHQSEDYNLSVALRQSWFQSAFSWVFYLPLAFAGFEPIMFLTISAFNTLYQFWIHTRAIGKMGPLELILNTPSHHRVHHGSDPKYLDKNHAGTLIIWDKMFGTFQQEEEEPHYGITTPLKSWNPVWANLHYWKELLVLSSKSKGIGDKLKVFIKPPGWQPEYLGGFQIPKSIDDRIYTKYDARTQLRFNIYILLQFTVVLLASTLILFSQSKLSLVQLMVFSVYVLFSLMNFGAILEQKKWSFKLEVVRLALLPVSSLILMNISVFQITLASCLFVSSISLLYLQILISGSSPGKTSTPS